MKETNGLGLDELIEMMLQRICALEALILRRQRSDLMRECSFCGMQFADDELCIDCELQQQREYSEWLRRETGLIDEDQGGDDDE